MINTKVLKNMNGTQHKPVKIKKMNVKREQQYRSESDFTASCRKKKLN